MRPSLAAISLLFALGCSSASSSPGPSPAPAKPSATNPSACGAGTMPTAEGAACAPVGAQSCASGFRKAASGWGCEAIRPREPCNAVQRAQIGEDSCIVVDSCGHPFPPADATLYVGAKAHGGLTSLRTLGEALDLASSGDVIAVDQGTYPEVLEVRANVRIVGRCATDVIVRSDRGIAVFGTAKLDLQSVTVTGSELAALYVTDTAAASVDRVIFKDNHAGAIVSGKVSIRESLFLAPKTPATSGINVDKSGELLLEDVEVRDAMTAVFVTDTATADVKRSVLRYGGKTDQAVLHLALGSTTRVAETAIFSEKSPLVNVATDLVTFKATGQRSRLEIESSQLEHSGAALLDPLIDCNASELHIKGSRVAHQGQLAVRVTGAGASAVIEDSSFEGIGEPGPKRLALYATQSGSAEISGSSFVGGVAGSVAAAMSGSRLAIKGSLIQGSAMPEGGEPDSIGVSFALAVDSGASLELLESTIFDNDHLGLLVGRTSKAVLRKVLIDKTLAAEGHDDGDGIFVGGGRLLMDESVVRASSSSAVTFVAGSGFISHTKLTKNGVGICTGGGELVQAAEAPPGEPDNITLVDVEMRDNAQDVDKSDILPGPF